MSSIGSVGQSSSAISALLSPPAGLGMTGAGGLTSSSDSATTPPDDLLGSLQRDVDYAFKNGKSLDEIGRWLNQRISATLRSHGVSDTQRQSILDQLQQVFAQGGSKADVRQAVDQLLTGAANEFETAGPNSGSVDDSPAAGLGQNVDFTA